MRPITLKISAFGPYAKETTLHFDELGQQRLFVITGPTGSGKTTIFEAILYALYGRLSKKGMDPSSLRCDFLPPEDDSVTYVELEFEIGAKRYKIHRQPKKMVAKKRGSGQKEIGQEVSLSCVGHEQFLPLTKISEVDAKIVELIGLEEEQFKKIVMLPQGAFQEFLVSNTKEKIELLRNIFNTSLYDQALQAMKSQAQAMTAEYSDIKTRYQSFVGMLVLDEVYVAGDYPSKESIEQLEALLTNDEKKTASLEAEVAEMSERLKLANDALGLLKSHNEDVEKWQMAEKNLQALRAQEAAMDAIKIRIEAAEQASPIMLKEKQWQMADDDLAQLKKALLQQEVAAKTCADKKNLAQEGHALAEAQMRHAKEKAEDIPALKQELENAKQYLGEKEAHQKAQESLASSQKIYQQLDKDIDELQNTIQLLEARQNLKQANLQKKVALDLSCTKLEHALEEERQLFKDVKKYIELARERHVAEKECQEAKRELAEKEEDLAKARGQNRQHAAHHLAKGLVEGEACPVCGAIHHPSLALDDSPETDEERFVQARDEAMNTYLAALAGFEQKTKTVEEAQAALAEKAPDFAKSESAEHYLKQCENRGIEKKKELDGMALQRQTLEQKIADEAHLEQHLSDKKESLSIKRAEYTAIVATVSQVETTEASLRTSLKAMEKKYGFTESIDMMALEQTIERLAHDNIQKQKAYEQTGVALDDAKTALIEAESAIRQAKAQIEQQEAHVKVLKDAFESACNHAFVNDNDYKQAKADTKEKSLLQANRQAYLQDLAKAETSHKLYKERLKDDFSIKDISAQEALCIQAQQVADEAVSKRAAHQSRCRSNRTLQNNIDALYQSFAHLENDYATVEALKQILDGRNKLNMRFETFAQAYYFEQMLHHANVRLAGMTNGRYSFRRKEMVSDARKQAGLDLDVMDQYTGRARDVATLSGGESFKASLSLALGLADVVTSESGGVELSTIFIDEGFGTLDEESLDDTVETLVNLQDSGRLVGVISHVSELKERIGAHLMVTSTTSGSHAHFEVRDE